MRSFLRDRACSEVMAEKLIFHSLVLQLLQDSCNERERTQKAGLADVACERLLHKQAATMEDGTEKEALAAQLTSYIMSN